MRGAILRAAAAMTSIGWTLVFVLGAVLHALTILIAFRSAALWGAISTAVIPVGAEIFWFGSVWSDTGRFLNYYTLCVAVFLAVLLLTILSAAIVAIASDSLPDSE